MGWGKGTGIGVGSDRVGAVPAGCLGETNRMGFLVLSNVALGTRSARRQGWAGDPSRKGGCGIYITCAYISIIFRRYTGTMTYIEHAHCQER